MSLKAGWLLILILALGGAVAFNTLMPQGMGLLPPEISHPLWQPASLRVALKLHEQGAQFVDARDPGVYKQAHVRGAVNLYPQELELIYPLLKEQLEQARQVVVYGRSRSRFPAATVAQFLRRQGLERVWVFTGDLERWQRAGGPVRSRSRTKP